MTNKCILTKEIAPRNTLEVLYICMHMVEWREKLQNMGTYLVETKFSWKSVETTTNKSSKFIKKITYVDDMMIHNLVKYIVQTRLRFWDILKFVIFISHKRSRVWTIYFIKLCIIISSTCVIFFVNLDEFFAIVCTDFHEGCGFHQIRCHYKKKSKVTPLILCKLPTYAIKTIMQNDPWICI